MDNFTYLNTLTIQLNSKGIEISEIIHEENCLFPMNLPLPFKKQFVLGFGGSASMVHPASGYMIGSLLRRALLNNDPIMYPDAGCTMLADPPKPSTNCFLNGRGKFIGKRQFSS